MEDSNSALLPYILQALSRKPHMSDTLDNLCKEVKDQLAKENLLSKYNNLPKSLGEALEVGHDLGIVYFTNEAIRLPFNFRASKKKSNSAKDISSDASKKVDECKRSGNDSSAELMFPKRRGRSRRKYVRRIASDAMRRRRANRRRRSSSKRGRSSRRRRR